MKIFSMVVAGVAAWSIQAAEPTVDQVSVTQSDVSRVVEVSYRLSDAPAVVTAELSVGGTRVTGAALAGLGGEINRRLGASSSLRRFYWKPEVPVDPSALTVSLTAWNVTNPPTYMVCHCMMTNTTDTIAYYASADQLPFEGGLTNEACKTTRLVFRKIPASGIVWRMGNPDATSGPMARHQVTFTNNYYIAIYPTTRQQANFMVFRSSSVDPAGFTEASKRPDTLPYSTLRGTLSSSWRGWPQKGHWVGSSSCIALFRGVLGVEVDLPTEAQWEFACRAGQGAAYYNGKDAGSDANLEPLAWFASNAGGTSHEVGLLKPNAWGLYDCLGNNWEWALDWYSETTRLDETDPQGPEDTAGTFAYRVIRAGDAASDRSACTCYYLTSQSSSTPHAYRLVAPCYAP